ncbi:MAG: hypothetical protein Q8O44_05910, partial [Syntrophales bacterium]|nr:hypothetical protein [Syntrophales bacterium]
MSRKTIKRLSFRIFGSQFLFKVLTFINKGEGDPRTTSKPSYDEDDPATVATLNFLTPTRIYYSGNLTC